MYVTPYLFGVERKLLKRVSSAAELSEFYPGCQSENGEKRAEYPRKSANFDEVRICAPQHSRKRGAASG
jgi:hypothetical protein